MNIQQPKLPQAASPPGRSCNHRRPTAHPHGIWATGTVTPSFTQYSNGDTTGPEPAFSHVILWPLYDTVEMRDTGKCQHRIHD